MERNLCHVRTLVETERSEKLGNIYGGVYQLMNDYYARAEKMNVRLEWFDGYSTEEFTDFLNDVEQRHELALANGSRLHVYMESPMTLFLH